MFTGLVTEMGDVASVRPGGSGGSVMEVRAPAAASEAQKGDSICVSGVCLTVTSISGASMSFDVSAESLKRSTLGSLRPGGKVNIEPSLKPTSKLGGHFVTGHVDAVGSVQAMRPEGNATRFEIKAPQSVTGLLVEKGSIAVDGVSLTVTEVAEGSFSFIVIPHTAAVTTIGIKSIGDSVNLEADILGKYVKRFLGLDRGSGENPDNPDNKGGGLMDTLRREGFTTGG
jgi:riboflavin synthase